MNHYIIPEALLAGVVSYLEARPYKEVAPAVDALRKLPQYNETPKAWNALAQCIRSGQIEDEDVPGLLEADPEFADWYKKTILEASPNAS